MPSRETIREKLAAARPPSDHGRITAETAWAAQAKLSEATKELRAIGRPDLAVIQTSRAMHAGYAAADCNLGRPPLPW